ncbi:MAG: flagellar basal body-associated FliL family protein [bacterium]
MAEEEKKEGEEAPAEEEKKKEGGSPIVKILIIVIIILVAALIAAIVASVVARKTKAPEIQYEEEVVAEEEEHKKEAKEPLLAYPLGDDPITARLADMEESHMVSAEVTAAYDKKYSGLAEELEARVPQLRDIVNTSLLDKTFKELQTQEGKIALQKELVKKMNQVLKDGQLDEVYIQLVIQ